MWGEILGIMLWARLRRQGVNLIFVAAAGLEADDFLGVGQNVAGRESISVQIYIFGSLVPKQPMESGVGVQLPEQHSLHCLIVTEVVNCPLDSQLGGNFVDMVFFGDDDGDGVVLVGAAVEEDLFDVARL